MYRFEEHTGEVCVRLRGEDFERLLREGARALAELLTGRVHEPRATRDGPGHDITLRARDREGLLVDWIDELIYLTDTTGQVFTDFEFDGVDATSVHARAWGEVPTTTQTAVKAATYHGLAVERVDGALEARLVLDV